MTQTTSETSAAPRMKARYREESAKRDAIEREHRDHVRQMEAREKEWAAAAGLPHRAPLALPLRTPSSFAFRVARDRDPPGPVRIAAHLHAWNAPATN